jgi:hypothetical protein
MPDAVTLCPRQVSGVRHVTPPNPDEKSGLAPAKPVFNWQIDSSRLT